MARFERIALVLSGGDALGAYQAGVYAALEKTGVRPNWIAGTAIGAANAVIVAGNLPHDRVPHLRRFWRELSQRTSRRGAGAGKRWARGALGRVRPRLSGMAIAARGAPLVSAAELRELIGEAVDFDRINSGAVRVVLGAVNLATGGEVFFDNDRHVIGLDHVMASAPVCGLPPVAIDRQLFGGGAVSVAALNEARKANTLCFAVDGYDPLPSGNGGTSRSAREIAAMRRTHELRQMMALMGDRLPAGLRPEVEMRRCLGEASHARMTIVHLVHEDRAEGLAGKMADFSLDAITRRWQAGESDVATSLAHPRWLAPPPPLSGVVVHEVRGGIVAPQR